MATELLMHPESQTLHIRTATVADAHTIESIARRTWPKAFEAILTEAEIAHELNREYTLPAIKDAIVSGEVFLLLEYDDEMVAYASYSPFDREFIQVSQKPELSPSLHLQKLYCLPEHQGKGFARELVRRVERFAELNHYKSLHLRVNRQNPSRTLYEKLGYEVIGEIETQYGPVLRADYMMMKQL